MINRALLRTRTDSWLVLQLRCITSEVKLFLERRYIINKKMFHDQWGTASHTDGQMAGAASTAAQVYNRR